MEAAGKQDAQKSGLRAARAHQEHSNEVLLGELRPTAKQTAATEQSDRALEAPGRRTTSRMGARCLSTGVSVSRGVCDVLYPFMVKHHDRASVDEATPFQFQKVVASSKPNSWWDIRPACGTAGAAIRSQADHIGQWV